METLPLETIKNQASLTIFDRESLKRYPSAQGMPMAGPRVGCGLFGISDDFIEDYQSLDSKFVKNKSSTFFFKASGNSMEPLIHSGDVLVVDRSITSFHKKVCVVIYENQLICKRVIIHGSHSVSLVSENLKHPAILLNENLDASVWGVVVARVSHL